MLLESPSGGNPINSANPWDPKHPKCCWKLVQVEISAIPQILGIPCIPDLLLETRSGGNPSTLANPWDLKHPCCCWNLIKVEIPAIFKIPAIPSIPDVAGIL
jgi:hypothetical protein